MTYAGRYSEALRDLLELRQPLDGALRQLGTMQPAGTPTVDLTLRDLRRALDLYEVGELDDAAIERWAEAVHSCDDVELPEANRELLTGALFELSSPELIGPMPEIVRDLRAKIGQSCAG